MLTRKRCRCHEKVFISCLSPCGWCRNDADAMRKCLYSVYRLAVDARPLGWWCSRLKNSELAQGFSDGYDIHGSQRHQHQTQGVYLGFCESYIICENLRESVGKINHTVSVLIRICSVRGLTVMLTVTAVWATRFKYCQPSFQKLGEGCGSVKSIIVNILFVW